MGKRRFYNRLNKFAKTKGYASWKNLTDVWFDSGWQTDPKGLIIGEAYTYGWNE